MLHRHGLNTRQTVFPVVNLRLRFPALTTDAKTQIPIIDWEMTSGNPLLCPDQCYEIHKNGCISKSISRLRSWSKQALFYGTKAQMIAVIIFWAEEKTAAGDDWELLFI